MDNGMHCSLPVVPTVGAGAGNGKGAQPAVALSGLWRVKREQEEEGKALALQEIFLLRFGQLRLVRIATRIRKT